jgi:Sugar-transfer associated ATP-grasp
MPLVTQRGRWLARLAENLKAASAESGVGIGAMLRELLLLNARHQIGVRAYFQYRLFDPRLTLKQKSEYLPDTHWANQRFWGLLNPNRYRLPFANKLVFNRVFGGAGLPVAKILGVYDPVVGWTEDGGSLRNPMEFEDWLERHGCNGFVFKPVWGSEGFQVLVFTGRDPNHPGSFLSMSGERYDPASLVTFADNTAALNNVALGDPRPYLLEARLRPHPILADFIGPTLCCVRVVTIVGLSGKPSIIGAVYKMQPKPLGVDHLSYGAVGCWVNLETGALGPGRSRQDLKFVSVIPGTAREFVGFQLPDWDRVKSLALGAAAVFPWARAIGWDIAISDQGPMLIEGNAHWSTSLLQIPAPGGLMTGELKALIDALGSARAT